MARATVAAPPTRRHPAQLLWFLLSLAACAAIASGCQHDVRTIDSSLRLTPIEEAEGLLFETNRRYIVLELVESPVEDIVDEDVLAFITLPWYTRRGVRYEETEFGFGWLGGALVLSKIFSDKDALTLGIALQENPDGEFDREIELQQVLKLSRDRETVHDSKLPGDIALGSQLEILGHAWATESPPAVSPEERAAPANP